jgi:hypothetical protein
MTNFKKKFMNLNYLKIKTIQHKNPETWNPTVPHFVRNIADDESQYIGMTHSYCWEFICVCCGQQQRFTLLYCCGHDFVTRDLNMINGSDDFKIK